MENSWYFAKVSNLGFYIEISLRFFFFDLKCEISRTVKETSARFVLRGFEKEEFYANNVARKNETMARSKENIEPTIEKTSFLVCIASRKAFEKKPYIGKEAMKKCESVIFSVFLFIMRPKLCFAQFYDIVAIFHLSVNALFNFYLGCNKEGLHGSWPDRLSRLEAVRLFRILIVCQARSKMNELLLTSTEQFYRLTSWEDKQLMLLTADEMTVG